MAVLLHVDMDAFFASVELLSHPEWRGRPLVVGSGPHERGVVSTCSYEARRFGIRSAMPSRTAYQLCPHAIFTPPRMEAYSAVSDKAFEVFSHYTPYVEAVSIDEAFLDITGSLHLHRGETAAERAAALGEALRAEERAACGVTCSVGIAPNRLLAKIGSEQRKPDGLTLMPFEPEAAAKFLAPRPIGILWGIGAKTVQALKPYGIATCGDIQRLGRGNALVPDGLVDMAFGISDDTVRWEPGEEKSVSREHTFGEDVSDRAVVRETLLSLVSDVGRRFRRERRWARTARLKLRDADFSTISRQIPFGRPARDDIAFRRAALDLFDRAWPGGTRRRGGVWLVGFGVTNFCSEPDDGAPSLFASPEDASRERRERLSETLDSLHERGLMP
ncbi:MAG: DNA polymerase IV [Kiritimatiellae bacterium]|nr:DNA polymerase IV [Kiritimatiellia bacterium]